MTFLGRDKKVVRETAAVHKGRNIVIELAHPSIVRVKEKGRRFWYETTVEAVFSLAAKQYAENFRKERAEKKKAEKAVRKAVKATRR